MNRSILVVDDDKKIVELVSLYLKRDGYTVLTAFDGREATFNRFDTWYGEPEMRQTTLFANAANPLGAGVKLYGWASYQNRDAKSAANIRRAVQDQNIASIYPDGFIPFIKPNVQDYAATGGVTAVMGEWDVDASVGYGKNDMQFDLENTLNRSNGPSSKTAFDAGTFLKASASSLTTTSASTAFRIGSSHAFSWSASSPGDTA